MNFYIIFLLLSFINMPMPGTTFKKSIEVPFFGGQTIETEFKKFNNVEIRLSGYVNENGTAKFSLKNEDIDIKLSENLNTVLKKYRTDFILDSYDPINQIIQIKLIIKPIFLKTKVGLKRIK